MTDDQIIKFESRYFKQFIFMCVLVCLAVVGTYFIVTGITKAEADGPGTFGDMFGACTCLFSGLAFAGLLYTVRIQKLELRITRDELKATADANKMSADATKKNLEVQRLSSIIAGRQTLLAALTGNEMGNLIPAGNENRQILIRQYAKEVKDAVKALEEIN